jgi:hypothetical protein
MPTNRTQEGKTKQDLTKCAMRNITFLCISPGAYPPFATLKRNCGNNYIAKEKAAVIIAKEKRKTITNFNTNIKFPALFTKNSIVEDRRKQPVGAIQFEMRNRQSLNLRRRI